MSQHHGCGWSACSLALMESVDIADWPAWLASGDTFGGYKQHVTNTLLAHGREDWEASVARHSAQVPYRLFQLAPSLALFEVGRLELTWEDRLAIRRWCKLRAGVLCFRHLNGRQSHAKFQRCIFCNNGLRNGTVHVLGCCTRWKEHRHACLVELGLHSESSSRICLAILQTAPGSAAFRHVLLFSCALADEAKKFWLER